MIARGDLAVEIGFARMAKMQEEILWIGEAAQWPELVELGQAGAALPAIPMYPTNPGH